MNAREAPAPLRCKVGDFKSSTNRGVFSRNDMLNLARLPKVQTGRFQEFHEHASFFTKRHA